MIKRYAKGSLSNQTIEHGAGTYIFPEVCDILSTYEECTGNETLGTLVSNFKNESKI